MKILYYDGYNWFTTDWSDITSLRQMYKDNILTKEELIYQINEAQYIVDDIEDYIIECVDTTQGTDIIYMSELNRFYTNVIDVLESDGYKHQRCKKITELKTGNYSALVSKQLGLGDRCMYVRVRKSTHSVTQFYGLNNIIDDKFENIRDSYMYDTDNILYAYGKAIELLNQQVENLTNHKLTKYPFSITGYAKKCMRELTFHKDITPIPEDTIPEELFVKDFEDNCMIDSIDWFSNAYHGGINFLREE